MTSLQRTITLAAMAGALSAPLAAISQQPATPPAPAAAKPPATAEPPVQSAYVYQIEGRRDPFVSLLGRGMDPKGGVRPSGMPGMLIAEVSLKGILKDRTGYFALLQGPDNKTYQVRSGDKLLDGSVKSINGDAVIFAQDVNDPLSVVKQREIVKKLRSTEEGRE